MTHKTSESGSILVVAMIILLVMSLMGVGLVQASVQSARTADVKTWDSESFHGAETCAQQMIAWLKARTRPPEDDDMAGAAIPADAATGGTKNLSSLYTGTETAAQLAKLANYSYSCTVTKIASKAVTGDSDGEGNDIGSGSGYGAYGDISPRYYYQVDSTGQYKVGTSQPNTSKRIISIVSLEF